ncbi:MAG: phosphoribosyl-ATP diphosphatase [Magnetovibrionaceae bacterium]
MTESPSPEVLVRLFETIKSRKGADPDTSYTAKLLSKGLPKISQKVGEEAVETVIAALAESPDKVADESADLLYHLLVLWAAAGIAPEDVWQRLNAREGTSGLAEKAARKPD